MSTEDAKAYLAAREVPRLFECLMTGLMFHRPNDHIQYLIDSLEKVKAKGQDAVTWNMFVEAHSAKTPLPPILPENGKRRPLSRESTKEDARPLSSMSAPLPPIGSGQLINVPVVFVMGGPCSGKSSHADKLAKKYPDWTNIHVGELLRTKINRKNAKDKWKTVQDLVKNGELAPQDIVFNLLCDHLKNNRQTKGFIIHGFPRNMEQAHAFETTMGPVGALLLIDCEEDRLTRNAVLRAKTSDRLDDTPGAFARRLTIFKEQTLSVLKYYDEVGKLYIIEGDQDDDAIDSELSATFDKILQTVENGRIPTPPPGSRPSTGRWSRRSVTPSAPPQSPPASPASSKYSFKLPNITFVPPPEIKIKDEGRRPDLPTAPIIFLAGGPGSGKGTQCAKITARYPDIVHISTGDILRREISERGTAEEKWIMIMKLLKQGDMAPVDVTEELLIKTMQEHPDAQAYLVEGYPRDALQYEEFNRNIGGHAFTILLDCESQYLHDRLVLRGGSGNDRIDDNVNAIEKKLTFFARNTLPLLKVIEDENKLIVIDGDRDEDEIFYDIVKCLDYSLYGEEK
ncbi:unnamed protein product, partial [Candidula unifasciata]